MKILLVIPSFYPAVVYGGPIFSTYHVCKILTTSPHSDLTVLTTNANGERSFDITSGEVKIIDGIKVLYLKRNWFEPLLKLKLVVREIKKSDVIHVQSVFSFLSVLAFLLSLFFRKHTVYSPRGQFGSWCLNQKKFIKKIWLLIFFWNRENKVVWHATSLQEEAEIKRTLPRARVCIIPNGIDLEEYNDIPRMSKKKMITKYSNCDFQNFKIIVSMARLNRKKGLDTLIQAASILKKNGLDFILFIAGPDDGYEQELKRLVKNLELTREVFFVGTLLDQEKRQFLKTADVFVLPSHNENFGNVYLESLACGTPIVASTNTPWSHVVDRKCGEWVPCTPNETAMAIDRLLSLASGDTSERSISLANEYSWIAITKQFEDLYKSL